MKWSVQYQLRCSAADTLMEADDCQDWSELHFSKEEALEAARQAGWLVLSKSAYCPACAKRRMSVRKTK